MRAAGGFLFISGISARKEDGTVEGVTRSADGNKILDIGKQTAAVIENLSAVLHAAGAGLEHLVEMTAFLVDMRDYRGFNEVYNRYFEAKTGPTRTTLGIRELPGVDLLVEIKAIAVVPVIKRTVTR